MNDSGRSSQFHFSEPGQLAPVRAVLDGAGFTANRLMELTKIEGFAPPKLKQVPLLLHRTAGGAPLDWLVRLFVVGVGIPLEAARVAVAPTDLERWTTLGLLIVDGDTVRASVQLRPHGELVVASDFAARTGGELPADYVMGITPSSMTVAGLAVPMQGGAVLDVGTGGGFLALVAARDGGRVVATDINPRAVDMARLNAALNGLEIDARRGDLFAPVEGERFDRIVSNPPFIISPSATHHFLHSGRQGDEVCRELARSAPAHLVAGGFCQFLANWIIPQDGDWRERLAGWFLGSGCEAWVMQTDAYPIDEYATNWIEAGEDFGDLAVEFDRWMRYYDEAGVGAVGYGLVTMRRTVDGSEWFRVDDGPESFAYPCGDDVVYALETRRALERIDDATLLGVRLRVADDVRLEQQLRSSGAEWRFEGGHLHRSSGLKYQGSIDEAGALLVGRCDGRRELGALLADLALETDQSVEELTERVLPVLRRLIEQRFLLLAG